MILLRWSCSLLKHTHKKTLTKGHEIQANRQSKHREIASLPGWQTVTSGKHYKTFIDRNFWGNFIGSHLVVSGKKDSLPLDFRLQWQGLVYCSYYFMKKRKYFQVNVKTLRHNSISGCSRCYNLTWIRKIPWNNHASHLLWQSLLAPKSSTIRPWIRQHTPNYFCSRENHI